MATSEPRVAAGWSGELTAAIDRTLFDEARKNELVIAYVRASTLALVAAGDWFAFHAPPLEIGRWPISIPILSTTWAVFSIGLLIALRRGAYHRALRTVLPLVDGVVLGVLLVNQAAALGREAYDRAHGLAIAAMACAVFAATGALRLTRVAAFVTGGLAVAIFLGVTIVTWSFSAVTPIQLSLLVGMTLLTVWMSEIVRRAMQAEVSRSTLARFLPSRVVAEAFATGKSLLSLVTEPRNVDATILVTDLRGFTRMSEGMAPDEVLDVLNEVQGALADCVREHGGTVDKFLGDGMLAVFGAPEPLADHAEKALATAVAMRARLAAINVARVARGQEALRLGAGLHAGPVVCGCLGSGTRLELTVIGDTVNTTSRLEGLTKDQGVDVLVSDEVLRRIPPERLTAALGGATLRAVGPLEVRGRAAPLVVHALEIAPSRGGAP